MSNAPPPWLFDDAESQLAKSDIVFHNKLGVFQRIANPPARSAFACMTFLAAALILPLWDVSAVLVFWLLVLICMLQLYFIMKSAICTARFEVVALRDGHVGVGVSDGISWFTWNNIHRIGRAAFGCRVIYLKSGHYFVVKRDVAEEINPRAKQ